MDVSWYESPKLVRRSMYKEMQMLRLAKIVGVDDIVVLVEMEILCINYR